ncbi:hypothetical protein KKG22_06310 [Patescibacteria group bacterium]|nr:hypothetical protein [Patescibacteria group bacterium]
MLRVKVGVPATAANLGAGFNCLGLALELYNTLEMKETRYGLKIEITGEGKAVLPKDKKNLSFQAANKVFKKCGYTLKGLKIKMDNHIPIARGLGSSAASYIMDNLAYYCIIIVA